MTSVEKYKKIAKIYYNRDDKTKKEKENFISQNGEKSMLLFFNAMNKIEEKLGVKFPVLYKDFIQSACIWILSGEKNYFCCYDEESIYEFNDIGENKGYSSWKELNNYLVIGQDQGESSYFSDPKNLLGFGTEAVWKVNRTSLGNGNEFFELVGKDFFEFFENCVNKKDVFEKFPFMKKVQISNINDKYIDHLKEKVYIKGSIEKTETAIKQINEYISKLKVNGSRIGISKYRMIHFDCLKKLELKNKQIFPYELFYILLKIGYVSYCTSNIKFAPINATQLELFNYGKKSIKSLKNMIIFSYNEKSLFMDSTDTIWDLFFIDFTNQIGNGSDAIYMICQKSKKIEEACYVAKDIVDLFRIFAEGEELNTIPIGK